MIKFRCANCKQKLGVPDEYAGRRIRCNKCSQPSVVPQPHTAIEEVTAKSKPHPISTPLIQKASKEEAQPNINEIAPPEQEDFDSDNFLDFGELERAEEGLSLNVIQMAQQD